MGIAQGTLGSTIGGGSVPTELLTEDDKIDFSKTKRKRVVSSFKHSESSECISSFKKSIFLNSEI